MFRGCAYSPIIPPNSTSHPNSSTPSNSSSKEHGPSASKRKQGKTMKSFSQTPSERATVEFNERGQPTSPNSTHLSSYLGTLAREIVTVNVNEWNNVDDKLKADLWTCIQTQFVLDEHQKSLLMMTLGCGWKEAKSGLVSAIRVASKSPDSVKRLAMLKPDNIKTAQEWGDYTKENFSEEFELKSKKFKEIRAMNNIPHMMSRKGYARLAEDSK